MAIARGGYSAVTHHVYGGDLLGQFRGMMQRRADDVGAQAQPSGTPREVRQKGPAIRHVHDRMVDEVERAEV